MGTTVAAAQQQVQPEFWQGRRVFLTGHTGFKGGWLALWLHRMGAEVTGYALDPPSTPSLYTVARIDQCVTSIHGDVCEREQLQREMEQAQPEVVFHLAAQALVRPSYVDPVATYATNVMGTVHLLDAVRHVPSVRAVVIVTSDKCYENREWVWGYREEDRLGGRDPYSNSKGCAELVTAAYRASFFAGGVGVATARAGNVIGGGDWARDRLLPDAVRAFTSGTELVLRNPRATRPWQHVLEPLHGYLMLAEALWRDPDSYARGWNFGPDDHAVHEVGYVVQRFAEAWGEGAIWRVDDAGQHPHEAGLLHLDSRLARTRLGWTPRLSLERALQDTAAWFRQYGVAQDGPDGAMAAVSVRQIEAYMAMGEGSGLGG